jgi:hypothetical protein
LVAVFAQSVFERHCTQLDSLVLQRGRSPLHCASLEHPALHLSSSGSQNGVVPPQSVFERHCTQRFRPVRHLRALAGQSLSAAHCTHRWVLFTSQTPLGAAQSLFARHW